MAIEVRISASGMRRYRVRVKDKTGRRFPSKTFVRRTDAERHERTVLQRVDSGAQAVRDLVRRMTSSDFLLKWHSECRSEVSEGWRNDQLRMIRDYVFPVIEHVKLQDLSPLHVGRVIARIRELGKSEQLALHVYNTLHKALEDAIHHYEILDKNPVRRRYKPSLVKKARMFLSPPQSLNLLQATRNDRLGPAVWISLLAGLRPSEVMALRWEAVNLDLRLITIKAAYKRKVRRIEPYPKQANWGRAVMPPDLGTYLQTKRGDREGSDFVASIDGKEMLSYHVLYKGVRQWCSRLGLPVVTPHELRHSSTELLVDAGASAEDLRRQLNHSSLVSTKAYIHRTDERLRQITDRIAVPTTRLRAL